MDQDFKTKLLKLYPDFDKVTGPYLRKDGRKHLCLNNSKLTKYDTNKKRTLSWPKALVEVREGRLLLDNETTDHIDEDFTNDALSNLQILSRPANAIKSFKANPERATEWFIGICPVCDTEFTKLMRNVKGNLSKGKEGPFCSRNCAGRFSATFQHAGLPQRQRDGA